MAEVLPHRAAFRARAVMLVGAADADDLVQDAYARVLSVSDFGAIRHPRAFVATIVHNLAIERLRRANVVSIDHLASLDGLAFADPAPDAFAVAAGKSDIDRLLRLIDRLPPQCRRVVALRKIDGLSPGAIAEMLSLSVSTVEKHLSRGLSLLTKAMREEQQETEPDCQAEWTARHGRPI